ncbi:MAG: gamma-glutamyltransferase [Parvibaculum sp.]|nr:gamma-glutamyltransferase [Parvibaculum sp.]
MALVLVAHLGGCSGDGKQTPLGTTVSSSLETKAERDALGEKKLAAQASGNSLGGIVIADEPTAALIGRDMLEKGGTAADAATAVYFALSATYPAAAGLGGGGVCLARDGVKREVRSISFLPVAPKAGGSIAVPGNVRGMAYLQASFGSLSWSQTVAPSERLAATGFQVSRATTNQLTKNATMIGSSPALKALYLNAQGMPYGEAEHMTLPGLAGSLGRIRASGVGGFYQGDTADLLVAQSTLNGGALTQEDLTNYRVDDEPAQGIAAGELTLMLPAANTEAGTFAAALWSKVQNLNGTAALADAANQLAGVSGAAADADYGSTSFVTVDGTGGAVACAVTMNGAFGLGRAATGSGIIFAATPASAVKGAAAKYLAPVILVRENAQNSLYASAAGAGAPKAVAAVESIVAGALTGEEGAEARALAASPADAQSTANAIVCAKGLPRGTCTINVNPKGAGVGFSAAGS